MLSKFTTKPTNREVPNTRKPIQSTFTAQIIDNAIDITETDIIDNQTRSRHYRVTAHDDETFNVPDDLAPSTVNLLCGIGQRMMYLKRWGFDREP